MSAKLIAVGEIEAARRYTLDMVGGIDDTQWFAQPAEGVTHIA